MVTKDSKQATVSDGISPKRAILRDSKFALSSQGISLLTSLLMSFVLPKFISVEDYGYWQLFMLYAGYVGLFHFGFGDGLYLKLGGQYFDQIDKSTWYPQIKMVSFVQICVGALILFLAHFLLEDNTAKQQVFYFVAIYLIIDNIYKILSFAFMATDKMVYYSKNVMLDKFLVFIAIASYLFFSDTYNSNIIISIFVISHLVVLLLCLPKFKGIPKFTIRPFSYTLSNAGRTMRMGIILMASNLMATLIAGSCRLIVEGFWDISVFAKVSFALTLSSFLLFFIAQISYVLFPFIRRMPADKQAGVLLVLTKLLSNFTVWGFLFYFPVYFFVKYWLPTYMDSLHYLFILAPMTFYEIKTNLIYNTYLKNLNKVKEILWINLITIAIAVTIYLVGVIANSLVVLVLGMLVAIIFRSLYMHFYLFKYYDLKIEGCMILEFVLSVVFVLTYLLIGLSILFVVYSVFLITYFITMRKKQVEMVRSIRKNN